MKLIRTGFVFAVATIFSSAIQAAPILFNFAVNNPLNAQGQMTVAGLTASVTAGSSFGTGPGVVHEDNTAGGGFDGLGVDSGSGDNSNNDINNGTNGRFEWLNFAFSAPVLLHSVLFTNVDSNDEFLLSYGLSEASLTLFGGAIDLGSTSNAVFDVVPHLAGVVFRITSTTGSTSDFRITGLSVMQLTSIPEPATLALCATALLAFALSRRSLRRAEDQSTRKR